MFSPFTNPVARHESLASERPERRPYYRLPSSSLLRSALSSQQPQLPAPSRPIRKTDFSGFVVTCTNPTAAAFTPSDIRPSIKKSSKSNFRVSDPTSRAIGGHNDVGRISETSSSLPHPGSRFQELDEVLTSAPVSLTTSDGPPMALSSTRNVSDIDSGHNGVHHQPPNNIHHQSICRIDPENISCVTASMDERLAILAQSHEKGMTSQDKLDPVSLELKPGRGDKFLLDRDNASLARNMPIIEKSQIQEDKLHSANLQVKEAMSVLFDKQALQAQLEELRQDNERLVKENIGQKEDILVLKHTLQDAGNLEEDNDRLLECIVELRNDLEIMKADLTKGADMKVKFENQLEVCRREKDELLKDKEGLKGDLEHVREKFKVYRMAATSSLQEKDVFLSKLKGTLLDTRKTVDELRSINDRLSSANKKQLQQERTLKVEINDLKDNKKDIETELAESTKRVQTLENENKNTWKLLHQAHHSQREASSRLKQAMHNFDNLREEYERVENELDKAEKKSKFLNEDNQRLHRMFDKSQSKLKEMQSDAGELKERFKRLQDTAIEWHNKNTFIQRALSEALDMKNKTNSELQMSRARNRSCDEKITELESDLEDMKQKKNDLRSDFQAAKARLQREADSMRSRLNALERQLYLAQRHIRTFDQMSSFQQEIRSGSDYESIRRCKNYSPSSKGSKVIKLVKELNAATYQFARHFVSKQNNHFFKTGPTSPSKRAKALLGEPVLAILQSHSNKKEYSQIRILLEVVLRMFLVAWCLGIIEGWYPKRQNFLDLLIKLNEPQADSRELARLCRNKTQIITKSAGADYHTWIDDILGDLSTLLKIGGIGILPSSYEDLSDHLLPILKGAYAIRTALAENDIYGNLEIYLVTFRTSFQPSCMDSHYRAHDPSKETPNSKPWDENYVIGNVALGLEANETRGQDGESTATRVILNPEVVVSSLDITHDKPMYSLLNF